MNLAKGRGKAGRIQNRQSWGSALSELIAPPHGLVASLVEDKLIVAGAEFESLYGGRTNRVWKVLDGDGDRVLKLYRSDPSNPMFRNDAQLEAACLQALADTGFVPRLRGSGQFGSEQWVYYDHAPGSPWRSDPEPVARLLRRLHQMKVPIDAPGGSNGSNDLERHGTRILQLCRPNDRGALLDLKPKTAMAATTQTCLIHGDPVAGNILIAPTGLTLIDWQCPAIGDPCEDLALFLSPAMQQLYRGAPLSAEEEQRFLTGYGDARIVERYTALKSWFAWRMAAYCLWRVENGSAAYQKGLDLELGVLQALRS